MLEWPSHSCTSAMPIPRNNPDREEGNLIAAWGQARLLKTYDGKCKLVGGSAEDRAQAAKWIGMFKPNDRVDGLPTVPPPPKPR